MSTSLETYTAHVTVRLKPSVNDPQGATVLGGLQELGFDCVRDVRVGKILDIKLSTSDAAAARTIMEVMCKKLLANPIIEIFEVDLVEPQHPTLSDTAW